MGDGSTGREGDGREGTATGGVSGRASLDSPEDRGTEDRASQTTRDDQPLAQTASPAHEEAETPDALERGGPAGTLPVGPAVDDVIDTGPPVPGAPPAGGASGDAAPGGERRSDPAGAGGREDEGGEREPLTSWTSGADTDEDDLPGVGSPPG